MSTILADLSQASMAHAVEANLFAFFQHLAATPRVRLHDDGACCFTLSDLPFPLFNSVLRARVHPGAADDCIDARVRDCVGRHVPMLWWTGPSTTPGDLGARLDRRGFLPEPARGMAADLGAASIDAGLPPDVTVDAVEGVATLDTWTRVLCHAFGAPQPFGDAFAELAALIGLSGSSPFRHFLARLRGEPVATCSMFLGAGVAGIYDVSTVPERRRRGLARAVTRAALAEAGRRGYRVAVLQSSALGVGVYRSLGFTDVCDIGQHVWAPDGFRRGVSRP